MPSMKMFKAARFLYPKQIQDISEYSREIKYLNECKEEW
jgi:hypothetical protein